MSLAEKLDKVMFEYDTFGYRDSEFSPDYFEMMIKEAPDQIIDGLLEIIGELMESCNNYAKELKKGGFYGE